MRRRRKQCRGQMSFLFQLFPPPIWRQPSSEALKAKQPVAAAGEDLFGKPLPEMGPRELEEAVAKLYEKYVDCHDEIEDVLCEWSQSRVAAAVLEKLQDFWDCLLETSDRAARTSYAERFDELMSDYQGMYEDNGFIIADGTNEVVQEFVPTQVTGRMGED